MDSPDRLSTGIPGLDEALHGGLPRSEVYLIEGAPGTGKTLLAAHFLRAGVEAGERSLFLSLVQSGSSLRRTVAGAGISLDGVEIRDFPVASAHGGGEQVLFDSADVELGELVSNLVEAVEQTDADRIVFDGVGYLRLLAGSRTRYRREIVTLMEILVRRSATVLFTASPSAADGEGELAMLTYGVLCLRREVTAYGNVQRRVDLLKLRGASYHQGTHDIRIDGEGLHVFPRIETHDPAPSHLGATITSGVEGLDDLLGGGLREGTSALIVGPSGTGKTSVATLFAVSVAEQGHAASVFLFDELQVTFTARSEALGIPVTALVESGALRIREIHTAALSSGEFAATVRADVDEHGARVVLIDSLTGYVSAMPDERLLVTQMHDLLAYLSRRGVLTILTVAQHGVVGPEIHAPVDVSYLADAVVLTRHFEADSEVRQAISVFKKRYGPHGRSIRELSISSDGIQAHKPSGEFSGMLSGVPTYRRETPPDAHDNGAT